MKRILFEIILVIGLGVAGYFAWAQHKASSSTGGQLKELTEQKSELESKLDTAEKQLQQQAESIQQMGPKEQQLGRGVVRLLSKGPQDQGALQALNKTLEQTDWNRNQKIICATQNALAAAGKDVKVLAECAKTFSLSPASAAAPAASAASESASAAKGTDSKKP